MKKFYFIAVALLISVSASAQFVNSSKGAAASSAVEDVFSTVEFTYSPVTMKMAADGASITQDMNAVSLTWLQARALPVANLPVYLQYGAGLQYAWYSDTESEDGYSAKSTTSFLTVKVPVNVLYDFNIPNTTLNVMPYLGLNLQGHIIGQNKVTVEYDGESMSETVNYFSKDDMDEDPYNRIVLGWQIGAKVAYDKYFFGIAYEGPVTNLYKHDEVKINYSLINISLGIRF